MRKGVNPNSVVARPLTHALHRVIVPVHIPEQNGYYKDSFRNFVICLRSLIATTGGETRITVIDNDSILEVKEHCAVLLKKGDIDRLVINSENRGKVEAVIGEARASFEPFITISDCDILFKINWLTNVVNTFQSIPGTGVIGLLTFPDLSFRHTSAALSSRFWKWRLKKVISNDQIRETYLSVGQTAGDRILKMSKLKQWVYRHQGCNYLLGNNHAVATYRREIFFALTDRKVKYVSSSKGYKSDQIFLDETADYLGWMRMSFPVAHALHMGNTWDESYDRYFNEQLKNDPAANIRMEMRHLRASPPIQFLPWPVRRWLTHILDRLYRHFFFK